MAERDSSNAADLETPEDIAVESAGEMRSTPGRHETPGQIRHRPVTKEAWKEPGDHKQDAVVDKNDKRSKSSGGKQSLWLMRTKRFCYEASVVGLRYVATPLASSFRRSVWVVLLLVGAGFTTFQIQDRIRYFLSRPINVNLRIQHVEEMRFPTVTICNENRITYSASAHLGK